MRLSLGFSLTVSCLLALPFLGAAACSSSSTTPNLEGGDAGTGNNDSGVMTYPADTGTNMLVDSSANSADTGANAADTGTGMGTDANTGSDGGACMLPTGFSLGSASCDSCLQTNCCEAVDACFNDTACFNLNNCLANCQSGMDDGGTFSADDAGALMGCEQKCESGVTTTVVNEFNAQAACYNPLTDGGAGVCETACQ